MSRDDILKFQAKATIEAMNANAEAQTDNEDDEDFGLVPEKPIYTSAFRSIDGEESYLNRLLTVKGEKFEFRRRGSTSVVGINGIIDIYDIYLLSGEFYKTIYMNMYGATSSTSAPKGFMFASEAITTVKKTRKPISNRLLIVIISISLAIVMITLPVIFLLRHKHDYRLISRDDATCTVAGREVFECSRCKDSYSEYLPASHDYILKQKTDATCTSQGTKTLECSVCHNSYTESIPIKPHNYTSATCTAPQKCSSCGKINGTALGHSNDSKCSRCGLITFETLTYSGTGSSVINEINLPNGQFRITCTLQSGSYTTMYLYYETRFGTSENLIFNDYDPNSIELTVISGPMSNASIVINGESSYSSPARWTIKIEAI